MKNNNKNSSSSSASSRLKAEKPKKNEVKDGENGANIREMK